MKRLLLVTTSLLLILPDIALAQQAAPPGRDRPGQERPNQNRPQVRPSRPGGPQVQPVRPGGPQIQPVRPGGPQIQPPRPGRPEVRPPRPGGPQIQPPRPGGDHGRPPRPQPPRPGIGGPGQHRPGAGRPPHFRPIRGPSFRYPRGYNYRRWSIGALLPALFLSTTYYYNSWDRLGVGAPPPGYRWVRYGPDLLLVQQRTGRVVDVIYGAFY